MFRRLAPLIACLAFVPGCSPVDTGDATVRWGVGLTGSCSGASLERVRVELATSDGFVVGPELGLEIAVDHLLIPIWLRMFYRPWTRATNDPSSREIDVEDYVLGFGTGIHAYF